VPPSVQLLAGIEAGGTKFQCGVSDLQLNVVATATIPTTNPHATFNEVERFFRSHSISARIVALGIASFGPVDVNRRSETYGRILATPKPGWSHTSILHELARRLDVSQFAIETDVTGAALAEHERGAARHTGSSAYVTIGTGIGAGFLQDGAALRTLLHPEFGHIRVSHDRGRDPYEGCCPFHGDCLEGLASGYAMEQRWKRQPTELPEDHPAWPLEVDYVAQGLVNLIYTACPERVIVGGGVGLRLHGESLRSRVRQLLGDYLALPQLTDGLADYIVPPALGDAAGLIGALILAERATRGT
jgi:fructokinase